MFSLLKRTKLPNGSNMLAFFMQINSATNDTLKYRFLEKALKHYVLVTMRF